MSSNQHPMLNVAVKAARAAGAIINRAALDVEAVRISQKQVNDFVTEVDHASEKAVIETLLGAYPDHGIWAEESGREHGNPASDHVWLIDPLDGTTNFIHGFPVYCVSIALLVRGRVEQAVIYDPTRNDLFTATRGRGAFLNERRIRVSKRTRLQESLVSTGFPFRPGDNFNVYLRMMADVMQRTAGLRRPGAAALDLAYVAAGYTDGFFETGLSPWDVAAGSLLVTEAGGLVGNFSGEADFLEQRECVAGNPRVYGQLVTILGKYSKFASAGEKADLRQNTEQLVDPATRPGSQVEDGPQAPAPAPRRPGLRPRGSSSAATAAREAAAAAVPDEAPDATDAWVAANAADAASAADAVGALDADQAGAADAGTDAVLDTDGARASSAADDSDSGAPPSKAD